MKALNVDNRKVEDFREDGRALLIGGNWRTTYESPSDPERVYLIDRFGYARSVYSAAIEQAYNCGRYALKSKLVGVHYFVDGKPYMGGDN